MVLLGVSYMVDDSMKPNSVRRRHFIVVLVCCVLACGLAGIVILRPFGPYEFHDERFWGHAGLLEPLKHLTATLEYAPTKEGTPSADGGFRLLLTNHGKQAIDIPKLLCRVDNGRVRAELLRGKPIFPSHSSWGETARDIENQYDTFYRCDVYSIPVINPGETASIHILFTRGRDGTAVNDDDLPDLFAKQFERAFRSLEVSLFNAKSDTRNFRREGRTYWAHRLPLACFDIEHVDLTKSLRRDPVAGYLCEAPGRASRAGIE
jgi:hypothetical protein